MNEIVKYTCVACKEVIQKNAAICPHCGSHQSLSNLHILTGSLKWAAGITAFLTLIISASELNKIMELWLEKERASSEYVAAAQLLAETGDFVNAQALLQQATVLNPASSEVRDLQLSVSQKKLRNFLLLDRDGQYMMKLTAKKDKTGEDGFAFEYSSDNQRAFDDISVDDLARLFARGIVIAEGAEKATLLAHYGWMELLKEPGPVDADIDKSFVDALQADSENIYANAMYGAWLLSPRNNSAVKMADRVVRSHKHFKKSLIFEKEKVWVKALWLKVLTLANGLEVEHELLRVLQEFKDSGDQFDANGPARTALLANFFIKSDNFGFKPEISNEQRFQALISAFSIEDLINKLHWLSYLYYGCIPGPGCETYNREMQNLLYVSGRLYETKNELDRAVEQYRLSQTVGFRGNFVDRVAMQNLEDVLTKQGVPVKRVIAIRDSNAVAFQKEDVILEYHTKSITSKDEINKINSQLEDKQKIKIKILRNGQILELKSNPISPHDVITYVIPVSLLKPDKIDQLDAWLSNK